LAALTLFQIRNKSTKALLFFNRCPCIKLTSKGSLASSSSSPRAIILHRTVLFQSIPHDNDISTLSLERTPLFTTASTHPLHPKTRRFAHRVVAAGGRRSSAAAAFSEHIPGAKHHMVGNLCAPRSRIISGRGGIACASHPVPILTSGSELLVPPPPEISLRRSFTAFSHIHRLSPLALDPCD
jgi:hypothetical protein